MLAVEKDQIVMETGLQGVHTNYTSVVVFPDNSPSPEYLEDIQHDMDFKVRIRHSPVWSMIHKLDHFLSQAVT
jgi:hypothetical protein